MSMQTNKLVEQYNAIVKPFINQRGNFNKFSDIKLIESINPFLDTCRYALDFGCGDGKDILYLQSFRILCAGVDSSSKMVAAAKESTHADIRCEDFAHTSFEDESFDLITSKWAMQTSAEINPIYREAHRILKTGGHFVFLVVHPLRQFIEKKKQGKDYFKKEIVDSIIFDGAITVYEPSHTLEEYLSKKFFSLFTLVGFDEGHEFPAAEQIGGDIYPTYMIITAKKK
jgi:SAM-dependent methyltransferase